MTNNWVEYWDSNNAFDTSLKDNFYLYYKKLLTILDLQLDDSVLDIGCGVGVLGEEISPIIEEYVGVDTSAKYISKCNSSFKQIKRMSFYLLDPVDYTNLGVLRNRKFSKIICQSVLQYYDSLLSVEKLLKNIMEVSKPGATCFLIDINPDNLSLISTLIGTSLQSFKHNFFINHTKFLVKTLFSNYYKLTKEVGLLKINKQEIKKLLDQYSLEYQFINMDLSTNPGRYHIKITIP